MTILVQRPPGPNGRGGVLVRQQHVASVLRGRSGKDAAPCGGRVLQDVAGQTRGQDLLLLLLRLGPAPGTIAGADVFSFSNFWHELPRTKNFLWELRSRTPFPFLFLKGSLTPLDQGSPLRERYASLRPSSLFFKVPFFIAKREKRGERFA